MRTPLQFSYIYLGANLFLIAISSFMGGLWLLNTQVAFICSMIITFTTFYSYSSSVKKRLETGLYLPEVDDDERDEDDPHGFYAEDDSLAPKDFKTMIKEEKVRLKKGGSKNSLRSLSGLFLPYRLVAYGFLFLAFLYLQRHELFEVLPFLLGLSVVPLSSLVIPLFLRE